MSGFLITKCMFKIGQDKRNSLLGLSDHLIAVKMIVIKGSNCWVFEDCRLLIEGDASYGAA